jgi:hypothetical protein
VENNVTVKQLLAAGARLIIEPPLQLSDLPVNKTLVCIQDDSINIHVNPCETEENLADWANRDNFKLWFLLETVVADKLFEVQSVN